MSLMMTVSQMTREGHHGQVGGRAPATLAVNRGLFLGAPQPVEGHRRQWPSWPSIISYPERVLTSFLQTFLAVTVLANIPFAVIDTAFCFALGSSVRLVRSMYVSKTCSIYVQHY